MRPSFESLLLAIILSLALVSAGCGGETIQPVPVIDEFSSFETDFEGWTTNALDVGENGGTIAPWTIIRSQDMAQDGTTSIQLWLENYTDGGKIWIEKTFPLQPNRRYQVRLQYAFASQDGVGFNMWTIIAGVLTTHPQGRADLQPAFQGDTGNGSSTPGGYVWLSKSYTFTVQSDASAALHVVIGVWGTSEFGRTYYVDSVHMTIAEI